MHLERRRSEVDQRAIYIEQQRGRGKVERGEIIDCAVARRVRHHCAIARNEGKVFEREFKVVTGVDGDVEVQAR